MRGRGSAGILAGMTDGGEKGAGGIKVVATNRKVRHEYHVLESIEVGIELRGTEVKALRDGQVSLGESHARVENGEVTLIDLHIPAYRCGNVHNHDPRRPRRLLLHRREIDRLYGQSAIKGHALIPLRLYFKHGRAKIELGLCRGKHFEDKRETLKRRESDREAQRAMRRGRLG